MAFRDTWHRTLVYFGLAEDDAYEEEVEPYAEPEVELQDTYRERPNVRRLSSRRRRDEIDDIFADDAGPERRTTALRPVGGGRGNGRSGDVRVHFVAPEELQRRAGRGRQVQGRDSRDPEPPGHRHRSRRSG